MLSPAQIKTAAPSDKPYKLFDAGGLFLLVRATGQYGWRFKYRIQGHEKLLSLGPYPAVSLAKARLKLKRAKALLLDGIDPSLKRKAEKYAGTDSYLIAYLELIRLGQLYISIMLAASQIVYHFVTDHGRHRA